MWTSFKKNWLILLDGSLLIAFLIGSGIFFFVLTPGSFDEDALLTPSFESFDFTNDQAGPDDARNSWREVLRGHAGDLTNVRIHPEKPWIATADERGIIKIWKTTNQVPFRTFRLPNLNATHMRFVPDPERLIVRARNDGSVSFSSYVMEFNLSSGHIQHAITSKFRDVSCLDASSNRLVIGDDEGHVLIKNLASWNTTQSWTFEEYIRDVQFTPDTERVLALTDSGEFLLLKPGVDTPLRTFHTPWDPSEELLGNFVVSTDERWLFHAASDGTIYQQNLKSGEVLDSFPVPHQNLQSIARNGDRLLVGGTSGYSLWDMSDGPPEHLLHRDNQSIQTYWMQNESAAFTYTKMKQDPLFLTAPGTREKENQLPVRHRHAITAVDVSVDGTSVYLGTSKGAVRVWTMSIKKDDPIHRTILRAEEDKPIDQLHVSERANQLVFRTGNTVALYSLSGDRQKIHKMNQKADVLLSPDGKWLAAGGESMSIYRTRPWEKTNEFHLMDDEVKPVQFHQNGRLLQYEEKSSSYASAHLFGKGEKLGIVSIQNGRKNISWNLDDREIRQPVLDPSGTYLLARREGNPFNGGFGKNQFSTLDSRASFRNALETRNTVPLSIFEAKTMKEINQIHVPNLQLHDVHVRGHLASYLTHLSPEGELVFRDLSGGDEIGRLALRSDEKWLFQTPNGRFYGPDATDSLRNITWTNGTIRMSPAERKDTGANVSSEFSKYFFGPRK